MSTPKEQKGFPLPKFAWELIFGLVGVIMAATVLYPRVMYYNWLINLVTSVVFLPLFYVLLSRYFNNIKYINRIGLLIISVVINICFCIFMNSLNELNFKKTKKIDAKIYEIKFYKDPFDPIPEVLPHTTIKTIFNNDDQRVTLRSLGHLKIYKKNDNITICKGSGLFGATSYKLNCN